MNTRYRSPRLSIVLSLAALLLLLGRAALAGDSAAKPNVLFIAIDDLNDWIGCLGGHPQAKTPNIDRLAASGMLFSNAHCPAPSCNPSRTAILTGISPHKSGLYDNRQRMREVLPDAELLPRYFSRHGYWSAGSGKILHYFIDARSWDQYFPAKDTESPLPRTLYPQKRPVSLPRGGPWQYIETDWGPLDTTDEEFGGDWLVSNWIGEQLARKHAKPFFLACGIYRPHEPWFVPQKYFDQFPLEKIQLPRGYQEGDLADLPPAGQKLGPNRYFAHIRAQDQWKRGIQGYLASIAFADAMVGRVIKSLEDGPNRDRTIVVLWSDHGWHLGEKQHWQKYTAWRVCTRVPLIVRVPKGTTGLAAGTRPGTHCTKPVNLLSLYPTLLELAGLPTKTENDGPSLVPLLRNPEAEWKHVALTHLSEPASYGLSAENWRLIHYANGDEELYHTTDDPHEWNNLAGKAEFRDRLGQLRALAPTEFAKKIPPSDESLAKLTWHAAGTDAVPPSKPDGDPFQVVFINRSKKTIQLCWMDRSGTPKPYGRIEAGQRMRQRTRPGAVWLITDSDGKPLGHFMVGDRTAQAVIPANVFK
ncbi:MAG: sulfatase-like hydrolase/transferase [Gemmataceae bacterium]